MARAKGMYGRLTSAARPPKPGSAGFKAWSAVTAINTWAYRVSGGRLGGSFDRAPVLLLHHVGRRSGEERVAPLLYLPDGDDLVVVASYGGAPKHPAWLHNLRATPDTVVEVGRRRRPVTAREATPQERERLWPALLELYPAYGDYQRRTTREIPLVVLRDR
ncbi:nitroreductase family deazaflavin-dependent oxidoreductase [Baekduia alba]|uniref:nitroreductase family deazaflavin-dependent oxidoreductase n=1 Tax=Baekduia alba TaxID=2997333 RepID=UPI00234042EB|nr:nitroreductase family deazaflavin-dependent oxidoreductase [Baekduia alba]